MPARPARTHQLPWFKSSYSGANTTECVECAYLPHAALIRDSKYISGPVLSVKPQTWLRFIGSVRHASQECA
ncbi:DUF397 domain-containing protein [Streptomyces olivaceus]|uniref:DUF397 domain-containing protein n=1 Tax=Streptomyces olivaceus TaxID=47716 RepID=UPI00363CE5DC